MQIHPINGDPVTMLKLFGDGVLKHWSREILVTDIYDRWIHFNIVHDVDGGSIRHYVNGQLQLNSAIDPGNGPFYFKCGVYTQNYPSHYTESRWRNITIWKC